MGPSISPLPPPDGFFGLVPSQCSGKRCDRSTRKPSRPADPTTCSCSRQLSSVSRRYGCEQGGHYLGSADGLVEGLRVDWELLAALGLSRGWSGCLVSSSSGFSPWSDGLCQDQGECVMSLLPSTCLPRCSSYGLGLCRTGAERGPVCLWPWECKGSGTVTGTFSRGPSCSRLAQGQQETHM